MKLSTAISSLEKEQFLEKNRISIEDFNSANIEWEELRDIGMAHESLFDARRESAEFFAKVIQGCNKVHSVRWRVKDPEHLMEKIVRKRIPNTSNSNEKYLSITVDNYHEIVTDLVGIRALHLFKNDYIEIDDYLKKFWNHADGEDPIYYYRAGDEQETVPAIFIKKPHPAGYRSIHYIFESLPLNKKLFTEVQVRTIFEEGWSEIDHVVRYPNFSDDPQIARFLQIFNRLAGSADEMGTFAKQLVKELQDKANILEGLKIEHEKAKNEIESNEAKIKELFDRLKHLGNDNKEKSDLIAELEKAVQKQTDITPSIQVGYKNYMDEVNKVIGTSLLGYKDIVKDLGRLNTMGATIGHLKSPIPENTEKLILNVAKITGHKKK
jgi:putative GTP pyrophosphokinase